MPATCLYPEPARSSPYPHIPLPEDPSLSQWHTVNKVVLIVNVCISRFFKWNSLHDGEVTSVCVCVCVIVLHFSCFVAQIHRRVIPSCILLWNPPWFDFRKSYSAQVEVRVICLWGRSVVCNVTNVFRPAAGSLLQIDLSVRVGLRPLACWYCEFESRRGYGWPFLVRVVCCQVEVSALGWSLIQRSPTECDRESSIMRRP